MTWNSLTNLATNQLVTETHLDQLRENIEHLGSMQFGALALSAAAAGYNVAGNVFHVYATSNQTPTLGVTTKLTWTNEDFDTSSWMDIATNHRFTPLVAGKYLIYAFCTLTKTGSTSAGTGFLELQKNVVSVARAEANIAIGEVKAFLAAQLIDFNGSTDYVEVYANIAGTGSGQEITKTTRRAGFGGVKVN